MYPYYNLIGKYFPGLSVQQSDRFLQLWDFYHFWNDRINVISRKDIDELYLRHVLHSLSIARYFSFNEQTTVLDVGTGGGFPGIPLAILFEKTPVTMADSIGKKVKVVTEAINTLQLSNAIVVQQRAENIKGSYDYVVSRAVAELSDIIRWTGNLIKPSKTQEEKTGGLLCLKGGDLKQELSQTKWPYRIYNLDEIFEEEFFKTKRLVFLTKIS